MEPIPGRERRVDLLGITAARPLLAFEALEHVDCDCLRVASRWVAVAAAPTDAQLQTAAWRHMHIGEFACERTP